MTFFVNLHCHIFKAGPHSCLLLVGYRIHWLRLFFKQSGSGRLNHLGLCGLFCIAAGWPQCRPCSRSHGEQTSFSATPQANRILRWLPFSHWWGIPRWECFFTDMTKFTNLPCVCSHSPRTKIWDQGVWCYCRLVGISLQCLLITFLLIELIYTLPNHAGGKRLFNAHEVEDRLAFVDRGIVRFSDYVLLL